MRVLITFCALVAYAAGQGLFGGGLGRLPTPSIPVVSSIPGLSNVQSFAEFAAQTGKKYADEAEQKLREEIFNANKKKVDDHNSLFQAGKSTFELGVNLFSDLSKAEFLQGLTGLKKSSKGDELAKRHKVKSTPPAGVVIPDAFDWREKGGVTPVKFQGLKCGACWSFAVTGAIEGHYFRKTGNLINLSEQNLVDCAGDYGNEGCDGGYQEYGFEYVIDNKGISKATPYPYIEKQEQCKYKDDLKGATMEGFAFIDKGDEKRMKEIIANLGPLACSVNTIPDSFELYKSGIYKDDECNKGEVNHAILVIGYGSENGQDYWIIKNSWTDKWGESGYMKLPRNSNNYCGIASECSYPVI